MRRAPLLVVLALLACATMLAGCMGGDPPSTTEYEASLRSVMADMEAKYGAALTKDDATASDLEGVRRGLLDTADELERLTASEGLEDDHVELVEGVRGLGNATSDLIQARKILDSDPKRAEVLTKRFAKDPSLAQIAAAAAALKKSGVDAGL